MTFTEKDFAEWRNFPRRMEREFGVQTYTGTDNAVVLVNYSSELKEMLRPLPQQKNYEFDLKLLSCLKCKVKALWLCLPDQLGFYCDDCRMKEKKSNQK